MSRKELVPEAVEVPADLAGVTAGRAAELLGLTTDSVRRLLRDPDSVLERNADGLYTLASVIKERSRREAKAQRVVAPAEAA